MVGLKYITSVWRNWGKIESARRDRPIHSCAMRGFPQIRLSRITCISPTVMVCSCWSSSLYTTEKNSPRTRLIPRSITVHSLPFPVSTSWYWIVSPMRVSAPGTWWMIGGNTALWILALAGSISRLSRVFAGVCCSRFMTSSKLERGKHKQKSCCTECWLTLILSCAYKLRFALPPSTSEKVAPK